MRRISNCFSRLRRVESTYISAHAPERHSKLDLEYFKHGYQKHDKITKNKKNVLFLLSFFYLSFFFFPLPSRVLKQTEDDATPWALCPFLDLEPRVWNSTTSLVDFFFAIITVVEGHCIDTSKRKLTPDNSFQAPRFS